MNNIKIFESEEFGSIRATAINGEPWFVGKDIADKLGYENPQKALRDHVDDEDRIMGERNVTPSITDSIGREQFPIFINESGIYSLILSSKLPSAKRFKRWVTSEVLPSIRKNGGYIAGQETLTDEELLSKALLVAQNKIRERDALIQKQAAVIEQQRPKTIFADAVSASKQSILIGELAKLICQNGVEIGQKRLFNWLRENGYLMRDGKTNIPKQKYVEMGLGVAFIPALSWKGQLSGELVLKPLLPTVQRDTCVFLPMDRYLPRPAALFTQMLRETATTY